MPDAGKADIDMMKRGIPSALVRRTLALIVAVLTVLALSACRRDNGGEVASSASSTAAPAADTFTVRLSEYKIIYPEKASAACRGAARELKDMLAAVSGGSIAMSDDWSADGAAPEEDLPEILVGATNRQQSEAAGASFGGSAGWSVTVSGRRIVVSASSDILLYYAVGELADAALPCGDGVVGFPAGMSLECRDFNEIKLAADGVPSYPIVYSRYAGSELAAAFGELKTKINTLLGSEGQSMRNDALSKAGSYNSETTEILIGDTGYTESAEGISRFGGAEYGFTVVGNKLVVGGRTPVTTARAVARLVEMLDGAVTEGADGKKSITLPCPAVARFRYTGYRANIPEADGLSLTRAADTGAGGLMLCYEDVGEGEYTAYRTSAENAGFTCVDSNTIGENSYSTYEKEGSGTRLYVAYAGGALRITAEPEDNGYYSGGDADIGGKVVFTQMALSYPGDNTNGMGYVLKLADGSFVIWDGGFTEDAAQLAAYLKKNTAAGEKPYVRLWILTHMHGDHIQCFLEFAARYAGVIRLDNLMAAVPDTYCDPEGACPAWDKVKRAVNSFAGAGIVKPHEGDRIRLPGADIEVLGTYSLILARGGRSDARNDTSVVTRILCGDDGILLPGDAQIPMGEALVAEYGEALRSKYVQVAHHGSIKWPTTRAFYETVKPEYAFFPGSAARYAENRKTEINKYVLSLVGASHMYVADGDWFELVLGK